MVSGIGRADRPAVRVAAPMRSASCGRPVTVTASLKRTSTAIRSPLA